MKTIDFCIPFVRSGLRYTEFLISNLLSTATYPDRISISISVHSSDNIELIKKSSFNNLVKRIVISPLYTVQDDNNRFVMEGIVGSANHCRAIQTLLDHATADVVIFSDYDMAFLTTGWDERVINILDNHDLCGVTYINEIIPFTLVDFAEMHLFCRHYQQVPNLSFLAITKKSLDAFFSEGISSYHHYLFDGGLPTQIVHTVQMAEALHLPLGAVWMMDSGFEIPLVIQNNQLRYQTFNPVAFDKQTVFSADVFTDSPSSGNLPDVFVDSVSGEPLLAHYGKGTMKSLQFNNNSSFDCFMAAVNDYLAK